MRVALPKRSNLDEMAKTICVSANEEQKTLIDIAPQWPAENRASFLREENGAHKWVIHTNLSRYHRFLRNDGILIGKKRFLSRHAWTMRSPR